jgi:hypothetical protein
MSEKQLFSVLVRGVGLLVFVHGVDAFYLAVVEWYLNFGPPEYLPKVLASRVVYGFVAMLLGAIMTRWPQGLVQLAWLERLPTIGRMPDEDSN